MYVLDRSVTQPYELSLLMFDKEESFFPDPFTRLWSPLKTLVNFLNNYIFCS